MDVAGARALARRIAHGRPIDDDGAAPGSEPSGGVDVVYVHPRVLQRRPKVWRYMRGPDGRLRRVP